MSAYVYSGSAQLVALNLWVPPLAVAALLWTVLAINARYVLQGVTLSPWLHTLPRWQRWGTLFFLSDASWATSLKRFEGGNTDVGYLLGCSLTIYAAWVLSTLFGFLIPVGAVSQRAWGLDFAISAAMIALAGAQWDRRSSVWPWAAAALSAWATHRLVPGNLYIVVGGCVGACAGALRAARANA